MGPRTGGTLFRNNETSTLGAPGVHDFVVRGYVAGSRERNEVTRGLDGVSSRTHPATDAQHFRRIVKARQRVEAPREPFGTRSSPPVTPATRGRSSAPPWV